MVLLDLVLYLHTKIMVNMQQQKPTYPDFKSLVSVYKARSYNSHTT